MVFSVSFVVRDTYCTYAVLTLCLKELCNSIPTLKVSQTDRQADRQTDRQTDRHTHTHTHTHTRHISLLSSFLQSKGLTCPVCVTASASARSAHATPSSCPLATSSTNWASPSELLAHPSAARSTTEFVCR